MMHITIIAVGRLKERFWTDACKEYEKRLSKYAVVKVREIVDQDPAKVGGDNNALNLEGELIIKLLNDGNFNEIVLLDVAGKLVSSETIAQSFEDFALEGKSKIALIIGSSCGVSKDVQDKVTNKWSFGKITLPHNLARVVALEQIYRAFKINRCEPYHK